MTRSEIIQRILRDCYWEYKIDEEEIERILKEGSRRDKKRLFDKIMYNSTDPSNALSLFDKNELKEFFEEFKIGNYKRKWIERRYKVLRYLLLGIKSYVKGLEWEFKR